MHHRIRIVLAIVALMLVALAPRPAVQTVSAQERLCFPNVQGITECIEGRFRQYWEQNGGLAVFGYPITAARNEVNRDTGQTYLTQWFERNRFELHPENQAPYDVLLGRLGDDRLRAMGIDWRQLPGDDVRLAGCLWFPQTQFNVCNQHAETGAQTGFMTYWQTHGLRDPRLNAYGRSLALFGLPLTRPRMETNPSGDTVLTQWFERARFEYHPNNPPAFRVLLGLLGNEVRQGTTAPRALKYFWPRTLPAGFVVQPAGSSASETAFQLTLTPRVGGPFFAQISGGRGSEVPNTPGGQTVTVRGQQGVVYTTGVGFSVHWMEDGQPYMVRSGPGVSDVLALAEGLEALDLATWRQRLGQAQGS